MAPHPRRRIDRPADATRRGRHRLRLGFCRARPAFAGRRSRHLCALDDETRAKLRALPSNDEIMAEAIKRSTVVLGETVMPVPVPQHEGQPLPLGLALFWSRPQTIPLQLPGAASQHSNARQRGRRPRALQHHSRAGRHHTPRADGRRLPGQTPADADSGDDPGGHPHEHDHDAGRRIRRHQERCGAGGAAGVSHRRQGPFLDTLFTA